MTADCITVSGSHVVIDLAGNSITGAGSGSTNAGIHVLSTADGVHLEGSGTNNSVSGFGAGVELDGSNAVVSEIELIKNEQFGVMINGGSNNAIYDLDAGKSNDASSGNGVAGVMILNGSNNFVDDIHADHNGMYGIELSGGSNNVLHDLDDDFNGIYGTWVKGSDGARVVNSTGRSNGQVGLYIGCAPTGGIGGACSVAAVSRKVVVKFGEFSSNSTAGIQVDNGDLANQIGLNVINSNGTADAVDANTSCATNLWFLDSIGTTPAQACIK